MLQGRACRSTRLRRCGQPGWLRAIFFLVASFAKDLVVDSAGAPAFAPRDYPLGAQFARQALVVNPDFWIGHFQLAQASVRLGEFKLTKRALEDARRSAGDKSKVTALRDGD